MALQDTMVDQAGMLPPELTDLETGILPDIEDIYDAVDYSDDRLLRLRTLRAEAMMEYGGRYWYDDDRKQRALNLTKRGIKVLVAHLAARNPRFEVSTERLMLRGMAKKINKQLDKRAEKAHMAKFQRLCMLEAFFGGKCIVRVGERSSAEAVRNNDRFVFRGEVYRRIVSFDDWIFDPGARNDDEAMFEGERYRISKKAALKAVRDGIFGYDATQEDGETPPVEDVATPREAFDMITDATPIEDGRLPRQEAPKAEALTEGGLSDDQKYGLNATIELIDLAFYVDAETCILVTMLADKNNGPAKFLRAELWDGPSRGPYEHLEFDPVPDNPHGPSVVSDMREQADVANTVIGKMINQIERTRRVLVYKKSRVGDALKITKAADGTSVGIDGELADIKDVELGGISPALGPFTQMLIGFWNMQGSFDVLGGQSAGAARTATEDAGLRQAANILVSALGDMADDFQERLIRHEAWYLWNDPFITAPMTMRQPGSYEIEVVYSAATRMGAFEDYNFKVKPRSMQWVDPNVRMANFKELLAIIMQSAQIELATQGRVDSAAVARIAGQRYDEDELDEIIRDPILMAQINEVYAGAPMPTPGMPMAGMPQPQMGMGGMPGRQPQTPMGMRQSVVQSARAPMYAQGP